MSKRNSSCHKVKNGLAESGVLLAITPTEMECENLLSTSDYTETNSPPDKHLDACVIPSQEATPHVQEQSQVVNHVQQFDAESHLKPSPSAKKYRDKYLPLISRIHKGIMGHLYGPEFVSSRRLKLDYIETEVQKALVAKWFEPQAATDLILTLRNVEDVYKILTQEFAIEVFNKLIANPGRRLSAQAKLEESTNIALGIALYYDQLLLSVGPILHNLRDAHIKKIRNHFIELRDRAIKYSAQESAPRIRPAPPVGQIRTPVPPHVDSHEDIPDQSTDVCSQMAVHAVSASRFIPSDNKPSKKARVVQNNLLMMIPKSFRVT